MASAMRGKAKSTLKPVVTNKEMTRSTPKSTLNTAKTEETQYQKIPEANNMLPKDPENKKKNTFHAPKSTKSTYPKSLQLPKRKN